jgi:hypothetical protein
MVHVDAIPLHQRELGVVEAACFAVAKHTCDLIDVAAACGEQSLHRVFGRGVQIPRHTVHGGADAREMHVGDGRCAQRRCLHFERARCREVLANGAQELCAHFERGDE